jgi:hypothetical protein
MQSSVEEERISDWGGRIFVMTYPTTLNLNRQAGPLHEWWSYYGEAPWSFHFMREQPDQVLPSPKKLRLALRSI